MPYKNNITILKSRQVDFEDLLRKTAELLRKQTQRNGRRTAVSKKRSTAG